MTERMYRAQILLDPEQHRRLRALAEREKRSISEVTRELLEDALRQREVDLQSRLERIHAAGATAEHILRERRGEPYQADLPGLLHDAREDRSDELGSH